MFILCSFSLFMDVSGTKPIVRDESSLRRQWLLLKALSSRRLGLTVREMAEELGVVDKTVRRDLSLFRSVGFPLEESVGEFGRKTWRIAVGTRPALSFTFDEAVALHLGRRLLAPLAGTAFGDAARRAADKIRATLGRPALEYLDLFAGFFHATAFGSHDYARRNDVIDAVLVAVEDGRAVRLLYRSERETAPSHREVHPCGLIYHAGALYLAALDPGQGRIKHYKVDRIEDAEALDRPSRRPAEFDATAHLASSFGVYHREGTPTKVRVRFAPAAARFVSESGWHASQRLTDLPDGGVLAEFRLSSTEALKRWVLGFGAKAEVVEPDWLRSEVAEELRATVAAYSSREPRPRGERAARDDADGSTRTMTQIARSGAHADD